VDAETFARITRRSKCWRISELARSEELEVLADDVDRHFMRFMQWYNAEIDTAYLVLTTGIRYRKGRQP